MPESAVKRVLFQRGGVEAFAITSVSRGGQGRIERRLGKGAASGARGVESGLLESGGEGSASVSSHLPRLKARSSEDVAAVMVLVSAMMPARARSKDLSCAFVRLLSGCSVRLAQGV